MKQVRSLLKQITSSLLHAFLKQSCSRSRHSIPCFWLTPINSAFPSKLQWNSLWIHNMGHKNVVAWHSYEVILRRARLVLRWVTASLYGYTISACNQPPMPTQPPTLSGMGNEYLPNGCEALQRLRDEQLIIKRYTNEAIFPYLTLLYLGL